MRKYFLISLFTVLPLILFSSTITTLKGKAIHYVGKRITIYTIDDYLSNVTTPIASSIVASDSSFSLSFPNTLTQQIKIEVGKDFLYIYVEPGENYNLYIDGKNPYPSPDAPGVNLRYLFLDLDSSDINYKTLIFDNQKMAFLDQFYNYHGTHSIQFVQKLDSFKTVTHTKYASDTSAFFKVFVKYSFASLDDLQFVGNRNNYEKYDFYIRPSTVWYRNNRYMSYIKKYFDRHLHELSNDESIKFTNGLLKSSPTLLMRALNDDYTLRNLRLRELILIDMLSEAFNEPGYPKNNIITVLDSIAHHALFSANEVIAKNIKYRLVHLAPGAMMPDVSFNINGTKKSITTYKGNHVYIQFIDQNNLSLDDLKLLKRLHKKYNDYIDFLTILTVKDSNTLLENPEKFKDKYGITWDFAVIKQSANQLNQLNVVNYPYYILMDANSQVVAAPALTPRPNGEYHTIEIDLYKIARHYKMIREQNNR